MGIWIHNYNTNQSIKNSVDLYLYSDEPAVYPTFKTAPIIDYNPNVFTNSETIEVNGEVKSVKIDFSGVSTFDRRLGDAGNVTCGINCLSTPWPHCDAFFSYTAAGDQFRCFEGGCDSPANCYQDFTDPSTGLLKWPFNIIDPQILDNAKYWNDVNLWHNGSYLGNILVEHDGLSYENGGYEYLISVGHAITSGPCSGNSTFGFFDPETKSMIYREFMCPCLAFESSQPSLGLCQGDDTPMTNDAYRLWVMVSGQEPIPNSIKRYKILKGRVADNFPIYGWHNSHRISKGIVKKQPNTGKISVKPDRSIPGSFGLSQLTFKSTQFTANFSFNGQGEDGAGQFTVTPDGETVFVGWHGNSHGNVLGKNQATAVDGPGKCNGELFYKNPETNTIEFNSWCLPSVYHPEEVIDNYPENDPVELFSIIVGAANVYNLIFSQINQRLQELGKPKIVFYQFPDTLLVTPDDINLPSISDLEENFPLKDYPYLSRESKNSFYENSNLIVFEQRKMLQASELNEFEEKFYRKQKLLIEYSRNWLSKKYLNSTNNDILGFSALNNYTKVINNAADLKVSTIVPFDEDFVDIIYLGLNNYSMVLKPNWYMLHSNYKQGDQDEINARSYLINNTYHRSIDFIKINEEITIPLNISNVVKIPTTLEGDVPVTLDTLGIVNIDVFNLIDCIKYSDLKDNSGGSVTNAPCGAKRNLLLINDSYSISNRREDTSSLSFDENYFNSDRSLSPLNSVVSSKYGAPHMAFYCVLREGTNNLVDVYLPNGFLIQTVQKL